MKKKELSFFFSLFIVFVSMWDAKREINKCGRSTRCTQNLLPHDVHSSEKRVRSCKVHECHNIRYLQTNEPYQVLLVHSGHTDYRLPHINRMPTQLLLCPPSAYLWERPEIGMRTKAADHNIEKWKKTQKIVLNDSTSFFLITLLTSPDEQS